MNHPTSPTEKNPRLCLFADGFSVISLPDFNSSPSPDPIIFNPPVVDYNTFITNPLQGGDYIAQKAGFHKFNVRAEAQGVTDFRLLLLDLARPGIVYSDKKFTVNPDRLICSLQKILYLNVGDQVQIQVQQYGQSGASLWPYPDANYLEVEFSEA